jgi:hypothetical protein
MGESESGGGRVWERADALAGVFASVVVGGVYFWTAAPSVTLLDSGEFILAAQHFGVPHPTGYPLWTVLAWLFTLLPLGNAAWEVNLFSGLCGALAVGLAASLMSSSSRWLFGGRMERGGGGVVLAVGMALLFAFSFSMWSQAVIAEVYTLHALLTGVFLWFVYLWLRRPGSLWLLLAQFFVLAAAFSNHQLIVALAPLPFLAVLLVRRRIFADLVVAGSLAALLVYLGFAILSGEAPVLKTAIRFFYCVAAGFVLLVVLRRGRIQWRLVAYLPLVVVLGLLPYGYMPLASSTNPPMNWSYTRTPEGFYYAFNRSQYGGSLSSQSLRSLGRLVGTSGGGGVEGKAGGDGRGLWRTAQEWVGFFWWKLGESFTPLGVVGYFGALLVILRLGDVRRRAWIYLLEIGFVLAAILQPVADGAGIDRGGWWLQMPYHTYTNLLFAVLAGIGLCGGFLFLVARVPRARVLRFGFLLLPLWPLAVNHDGCSQRGRWFGWEYGHGMLADLPRGSVVLGGTDPGRFVPTYMILGEGGQPAEVKRDGGFDRRDLFIITQNGVGEPLYRKYLRDQYGEGRPSARNAFERWLGRDRHYPEETLDFPTDEEIEKEVARAVEEAGGAADPSLAHSVVTRMIWERNKERRAFFVEESFPLEWSYDHAEPHGLVYKIHPEPLEELAPGVVAADFDFWEGLIRRLGGDPLYRGDFDAQRSFSKLRATGGNLYRHRGMEEEAERAYRQALRLWVGNAESLTALGAMLWERGDFDGVIGLLEPALAEDPNNIGLWRMMIGSEERRKLQGEIERLEGLMAGDPGDAAAGWELLRIQAGLEDTNAVAGLIDRALEDGVDDRRFLFEASRSAGALGLSGRRLAAAQALVEADPATADHHLELAEALLGADRPDEAAAAARKAIELGGLPMREVVRRAPVFQPIREEIEAGG